MTDQDKKNQEVQEKKEPIEKVKIEGKEEKKATKETAKKVEEKKKKTKAIAFAKDLHVSKKQCMYISKEIKGRRIDDAIDYLNQVISMKVAVPFKGEIPHRKGNMMSGRYPIKASKLIITALKGLRGNAIVNGLDLDKTIIYESCSNDARSPARSGGRRAKRAQIMIIAKEIKSSEGVKK